MLPPPEYEDLSIFTDLAPPDDSFLMIPFVRVLHFGSLDEDLLRTLLVVELLTQEVFTGHQLTSLRFEVGAHPP